MRLGSLILNKHISEYYQLFNIKLAKLNTYNITKYISFCAYVNDFIYIGF